MRIAPFSQGVFYVATGLWPVVHLRSFEAVTGKKREAWLVRTLGGLITVVGIALIAASKRRSNTAKLLGIGSAAVLGASDLIYAGSGRIRPVYFADAAAEAAAIATWLVTE